MRLMKLLSATCAGVMAAASAQAASQGTAGPTSTGTIAVTMDILEEVKISNLVDIALGLIRKHLVRSVNLFELFSCRLVPYAPEESVTKIQYVNLPGFLSGWYSSDFCLKAFLIADFSASAETPRS